MPVTATDTESAAPPMSAFEVPTQSVVRAAPVVAFVAGLMFCVPVITQVIGICTALLALLRRRLPNERIALAWVGLVLSAIALPLWLAALYAMSTTTTAWMPTRMPVSAQGDADRWGQTDELVDQMHRIHRAAAAHYRDYRRWPDGVEPLIGRSLPSGFKMSRQLTYRSVPPTEHFSTEWALIISEPVTVSPDGEELDPPHRLVLRLNGKIQVLPEAKVDTLLREQPMQPDVDQPSSTQTPGSGN